jgi:hypothetical protein
MILSPCFPIGDYVDFARFSIASLSATYGEAFNDDMRAKASSMDFIRLATSRR